MSEEQGRSKDTEVAPTTEDVSVKSTVRSDVTLPEKSLSQGSEPAKAEDGIENEMDAEADSEAETLIQSPEKKRSVNDAAPSMAETNGATGSVVFSKAPSADVQSRKRKRSIHERTNDQRPVSPARKSSPLSSPIAHMHSEDSGGGVSARKRSKNVERRASKRNGAHGDSGDSDTSAPDSRRASETHIQTHRRNKRSMDTAERRETRSATYPRPSDDERSPSPQFTSKREHRRVASTQLVTSEFERRKRGRPPTLNTRRHRSTERTGSPESDDESPAPPRSALHKLAGQDHDTMSPVKTGPRKWRDKNGRTWVARAANNDDLDGVKARLAERPQDLDLADNAGNSPLQIAALEGFVDIVEFLLSQGCDVDSRNIDKDTPLIDAVENGHLEVVKLLLKYGANPRLGNAKGDEPYELVPQDDENYTEIRKLLADAKERDSGRHRAQAQNEPADHEGRPVSRAASAASPRDSPPAGPRSPPPMASSRRRTGRSESTRNDLLWQAHTQENLTKLAGKGDAQGVASILNILQKASTESLIAAAKAGHNDVLQYLLAMGEPEIDPDPLRSFNPGFNTPLLAAIGRGHVDVVKLLVNQPGFNPMRRVLGKTYFEFAEERKGQEWQREYDVLKAAYDKYATSKGKKQSSPRKTRDSEKVRARVSRRSSSPAAITKRLSSSPTTTHKSLPTKSAESSPRETRKAAESPERRRLNHAALDAVDSSSIAVSSDLDQNVKNSKKGPRPRRSQSDLPTPRPLDNSVPQRRRRLVTGGEHRRNQGSAPGSASDDDSVDMIEVKQEDRPTPTLKRSRSSHSSDVKHAKEDEDVRQGNKKRRTIESSPEEMRTSSAKLPSPAPTRKASAGSEMDGVEHEVSIATNETPENELKSSNTDKIPQSAISQDVQQPTNLHTATGAIGMDKSNDIHQTQKASIPVLISDKQELTEDPDSLVKADTERKSAEDRKEMTDQALSSGTEPLQAEKPQDVHESIEQPTSVADVETDTQGITTEQLEPASQPEIDQELEKIKFQAQLEADHQAELENHARRKAEDEETQRQLEIRICEENEAKERQREAEAALKRIEDQRIESLPATLARTAIMIDRNDPMLRSEKWLRNKFGWLWVIHSEQMDPDTPPHARDQKWLPNWQVACLLATKDLDLLNYPTLEKREATPHERWCMWRFGRHHLAYDNPLRNSWDGKLGDPQQVIHEKEQREKFMNLPGVFWVKLDTFMDLVPRFSHLANLKLDICRCSLKGGDPKLKSVMMSNPPTKQAGAPVVNGNHVNGHVNGNDST